jgi:hypothetical protein
LDLTLALVALIFAGSSFTIDALLAFGIPLRPDSSVAFARLWYDNYAGIADPLLVANPMFLRIQATICTFVFGPFYLALAYALARGLDWIRIPALMYSAANIYCMTVVFGVNMFGEYRPTHVPLWLLCTAPYLIYPFILAFRMRSAQPFSEARSAQPLLTRAAT